MLFQLRRPPFRHGFTILESLVMIALMTLLSVVSIAIYLKETDPNRKKNDQWKSGGSDAEMTSPNWTPSLLPDLETTLDRPGPVGDETAPSRPDTQAPDTEN